MSFRVSYEGDFGRRFWRSEKVDGEDLFETYPGRVDLVNSTMLRLAGPEILQQVEGPPARLRAARRPGDIAAEKAADALRVWKLPQH